VEPTVVAMARTFGLGAEIQSPTGLSVIMSACVCVLVTGRFGGFLSERFRAA